MKRVTSLLRDEFAPIVFSAVYESEPHGGKYKRPFLNMLARFSSDLSEEDINEKLKNLERKMGRKMEDKNIGRVIIDIDIICVRDVVLRPKDFERDYVQKLLGDLV